MTRKELLISPGYWIAWFQMELFRCVKKYMTSKSINQTQLASQLGVSKGYVSQILNGDYDRKMSSFIKLSLAAGYVPEITFKPIREYILEDERKQQQTRGYAPCAFNVKKTDEHKIAA